MPIFFLIIFLGLLAVLTALIASFYGFLIGAPYLWTPRKALKEVFAIAQLKPDEVFYDLGAGDGKTMILAEKEFGVRPVGFELSPLMFFVAKLNLFLRGAKNSEMRFKNFYKQNLSDAATVFCFLSVKAMQKLKPKFEKELRPGAKVISYCFSIHGWKPKKVISGKYSGNIYIYEI